jgi:hypothetical protein
MMNSEDLFTIPKEVQAKYNNGTSTWKIVTCPINLYNELLIKDHYYDPSIKDKVKVKFAPLLSQVIDPNDKCNRIDLEELKKKQGILKTIFKGRPLPDLSLVQKTKCRPIDGDRHECQIMAVNDGGHRSRAILEFILGKFSTSADTIFISAKGSAKNIGHKYFADIEKEFPEAIEQFYDYYLTLCIQWNLDAKQRKEDFDDRNETTPAKKQQGRNAYDDNHIADVVRNCTRVVDGEENPNAVHPLFTEETLGFKNKKMLWDELVVKIMKMNYDETASSNLDQDTLDDFYLLGSYAGNDCGELHSNSNRFKTLLKDTYMVLDFLDEVLKAWPKKIYPKGEGVVHALLRWYFQYTTELKRENATFIYNDKIKIDYKTFAKQFAVQIMKKNLDDDNKLRVWTKTKGKADKKRTKADVFTGFLGQFAGGEKTKMSIKWIMEDFHSVVTDIKCEIDFGITTYDNRETFKQKDIVNRWMSLDEKDDLGNSIEVVDICGDHDIPRSWGRLRGGYTCPKTNMKILHYKDNNEKSNHMTFKEYNDKKAA